VTVRVLGECAALLDDSGAVCGAGATKRTEPYDVPLCSECIARMRGAEHGITAKEGSFWLVGLHKHTRVVAMPEEGANP
jgi:hypothetical protein